MQAKKIYGLMMVHGISVREIAQQEGVHRSLVHKAIRGERTGPAARRVRERIAAALGMEVSALWDDTGEERRTTAA